ncbi:unnamed protein product [Trifolium pratense]|uniref:Uncharacterized protein n=1 Tax=Trifolium pratense TaxID=57577 RepID=A0ACB0J2N7_TRIPR|nr:unnamed protein product [Trifolium pratense]
MKRIQIQFFDDFEETISTNSQASRFSLTVTGLINMLKILCSILFSAINKKNISTNRQNLTGTLTSLPSLPTLPFDLIPEILSRLPVKQLLQLRCVCKSWKSLISDPKFAKKHLALSSTYNLHGLDNHCFPKRVLKSYSLNSSVSIAQIDLPSKGYVLFLGSCNGILCLAEEGGGDLFLVRLWNTSIRKFKELPPIRKPIVERYHLGMSGFGHDPISDIYKVVVVLLAFDNIHNTGNYFSENEVKVHTLGTDSWKSVSMFPFAGVFVQKLGQYASGKINWLVSQISCKVNVLLLLLIWGMSLIKRFCYLMILVR